MCFGQPYLVCHPESPPPYWIPSVVDAETVPANEIPQDENWEAYEKFLQQGDYWLLTWNYTTGKYQIAAGPVTKENCEANKDKHWRQHLPICFHMPKGLIEALRALPH